MPGSRWACRARFRRGSPGRSARRSRGTTKAASCAASSRASSTSWPCTPAGGPILDAVEQGFELDGEALSWSRGILRDFGNMSSATLMFVLERILRSAATQADGLAMAFGPGMVAETFRFRLVLTAMRRDFSRRSDEPELMDGAGVDLDTFRGCLNDLATVNTLTLTRRPTLAWLARATRDFKAGRSRLGARRGLRARRHAARHPRLEPEKRLRADLVGVDLNPWSEAVGARGHAARHGHRLPDRRRVRLGSRPTLDFVVSSQVTHHLSDGQLVAFLRWMERDGRAGLVRQRPAPARRPVPRLPPPVAARRLAPVRAARRPGLDRAELPPRRLAAPGSRRRARPAPSRDKLARAVPAVRGPDQMTGGGRQEEIVVVGGGPAGAAAACRLARAGRLPLLLERDTGPRHAICGEFLSVEAQAYLADLGVDARALGGAPIRSLRLVEGAWVAEARAAVSGRRACPAGCSTRRCCGRRRRTARPSCAAHPCARSAPTARISSSRRAAMATSARGRSSSPPASTISGAFGASRPARRTISSASRPISSSAPPPRSARSKARSNSSCSPAAMPGCRRSRAGSPICASWCAGGPSSGSAGVGGAARPPRGDMPAPWRAARRRGGALRPAAVDLPGALRIRPRAASGRAAGACSASAIRSASSRPSRATGSRSR